MIRRDYLMRMVQEMAQVLVRAVSLRHRQEYDQAIRELSEALRQVKAGVTSDQDLDLEGWIALCRKHEGAAPQVMVAVGDLLAEQSHLLALSGREPESQRARALAMGLLLESLLSEGVVVSSERVEKVDLLFVLARQHNDPWPPGLGRRLMEYFSVRGRFAKAEDVLFAWLEQNDPEAALVGRSFYERLASMNDAALEEGGLPREEVEQGQRELTARGP